MEAIKYKGFGNGTVGEEGNGAHALTIWGLTFATKAMGVEDDTLDDLQGNAEAMENLEGTLTELAVNAAKESLGAEEELAIDIVQRVVNATGSAVAFGLELQ